MTRPLKYREMWKRLKKHDKHFEQLANKGKGSERIIYHPNVGGQKASYPVKCHGEGMELRRGMLKAIIRRFKLPSKIFD